MKRERERGSSSTNRATWTLFQDYGTHTFVFRIQTSYYYVCGWPEARMDDHTMDGGIRPRASVDLFFLRERETNLVLFPQRR